MQIAGTSSPTCSNCLIFIWVMCPQKQSSCGKCNEKCNDLWQRGLHRLIWLSAWCIKVLWIHHIFRLRICILHLHSHLREVSALTIENTKAATDTTLKMNKIVSLYWNGTEVKWTSLNFAYLFSGPWYNNCSHLIHCKAVDWVFVPTQGRSYFKIKFTVSILMLLFEKHTYSHKTGILMNFNSWK